MIWRYKITLWIILLLFLTSSAIAGRVSDSSRGVSVTPDEYTGSLYDSGRSLREILYHIDSYWRASAFIYRDEGNLYLPVGKYLGIGTIPIDGVELAINGTIQATHFQTGNNRAGIYQGTIYTDGLIYGMDVEATRRFVVDSAPGITWSGDLTEIKSLTIEGGIITGIELNE